MKHITSLLMALGLTLPAIAFGQEDRMPPRRGGDGPRAGEFRERGFPPPMMREGGPRREFYRQERRGPGPMAMRGRGMGFRGGQRPPPLIGVLDRNHDGVIDEREMDQAGKALRQLDRNDDGRLTFDELRPRDPGFDRGGRPGDMRDRPDGERGPGQMRRPRDDEGPRGEFRERREEVRRERDGDRREEERREIRRGDRPGDRDPAEKESKKEDSRPRPEKD